MALGMAAMAAMAAMAGFQHSAATQLFESFVFAATAAVAEFWFNIVPDSSDRGDHRSNILVKGWPNRLNSKSVDLASRAGVAPLRPQQSKCERNFLCLHNELDEAAQLVTEIVQDRKLVIPKQVGKKAFIFLALIEKQAVTNILSNLHSFPRMQ
jgi:hypothetical protein